MELSFLETASRGIQVALYLAAPTLALSLAVGFMVSIFQAVTSIQEQTLTFVPKIFITGLAMVVFGPWMYNTMNAFAVDIFGHLENFVR
jgi:flagellar biosynthesis protein FliQ